MLLGLFLPGSSVLDGFVVVRLTFRAEGTSYKRGCLPRTLEIVSAGRPCDMLMLQLLAPHTALFAHLPSPFSLLAARAARLLSKYEAEKKQNTAINKQKRELKCWNRLVESNFHNTANVADKIPMRSRWLTCFSFPPCVTGKFYGSWCNANLLATLMYLSAYLWEVESELDESSSRASPSLPFPPLSSVALAYKPRPNADRDSPSGAYRQTFFRTWGRLCRPAENS